jgi:hypothetical protein
MLEMATLNDEATYRTLWYHRVNTMPLQPITMVISPYWSFVDTILVPTVARVHFLSTKLRYNTGCLP